MRKKISEMPITGTNRFTDEILPDSAGGPAHESRRSIALEAIIRLSQHTPLRRSGSGFGTLRETFVKEGRGRRTESDVEAMGVDGFLGLFSRNVFEELRHRRILDFGCGFGGKAVELASRLTTSTVVGVEVHQHKIIKASDYAQRRRVQNCNFLLCTAHEIPLQAESVDAIISHDVIEHVLDPAASISELRRVLKRGGRAYIVFPPYDGALSHHLDYITMVPGLHWCFSADTIMETVNQLLTTEYGRRFNTPPQPLPTYSVFARKRVLPSLNGLGTRDFLDLAKTGFHLKCLERVTIFHKLQKFGMSYNWTSYLSRATCKLVPMALEHMTVSLVIVLEKQ
jgi:ubiquinone/menaquinone biosynthesis C-methylase UbiE